MKTNYKYWLENGECLEYSLSPDCDLVKVIDYLASDYVSKQVTWIPDKVLIRPDMYAALQKQFISRGMFIIQNSSPSLGLEFLTIQTIIGPMRMIPVPDLEYPIFIGRHKEYKDNCFDALMEDVLSESPVHRGSASADQQVDFSYPFPNVD